MLSPRTSSTLSVLGWGKPPLPVHYNMLLICLLVISLHISEQLSTWRAHTVPRFWEVLGSFIYCLLCVSPCVLMWLCLPLHPSHDKGHLQHTTAPLCFTKWPWGCCHSSAHTRFEPLIKNVYRVPNKQTITAKSVPAWIKLVCGLGSWSESTKVPHTHSQEGGCIVNALC